MSMHDPYGRPRPRPDDMARGSGWIFGGMLALLLILGIIMWGGTGERETAGVVDPPAATGPATTGSASMTTPPAQPSTTGSATD